MFPEKTSQTVIIMVFIVQTLHKKLILTPKSSLYAHFT